MRKLLYFLFLFSPALVFGQVLKTAAVPYTKGSGFTPNTASSSEIRIDTATSSMYWWDRDNLTWMRVRPGPDVITGGSAPAYTPRDNQSLFAVNADGELYYYNSPSWVQIGGAGGGGIYGGSGGVPDGTTATLVDDFEFTGPDISSFTVTTGTSTGGQIFSNLAGASLIFRDTTGSTSLALSGNGALFSFNDGSTDRLTIGGRDARYSGDYSATYSARSLIDKGYADGAYLSDANWTTGFSSATQATSSWTATNAATNVNAAIVPKGTGGILADVPDGTSAGGNARGTNAIDLQTSRNAATQVASGAESAILYGRRNTASGTRSAAGGNGSTASGTNSVAIGVGANCAGSQSFTWNGNVSVNDAVGFNRIITNYGEFGTQSFSFLRLNAAVTGTSPTEIFLDGSALRATLSSNVFWVCEISAAAQVFVQGDGTCTVDDIYAESFQCVIANKGGTTAIIGTVDNSFSAKSDASMSDASFAVTADDTNDALIVTFTPPSTAGSTTQINAWATIRFFEY